MPSSPSPIVSTVSVIIVTYQRPEYLARALEHLSYVRPLPLEIVVVDASADPRSPEPVAGLPMVNYLSRPDLAGAMTRARNAGLVYVTGDVVAFLDDDAYVRPEWMSNLVRGYADPVVAAAAGRTCNGLPGEQQSAPDSEIGRVLPDGTLSANFAVEAAGTVEVDHGIGANMSFRRKTLGVLGGFRDDFSGTALREDTDMFLRVRALGGRVLYLPGAIVDHVAAPHVVGARFDTRYKYFARRNHVLLLARNYGLGSTQLRRYLGHEVQRALTGERLGLRGRLQRVGIVGMGLAAGLLVSVRKAKWRPSAPFRRDDMGLALTSKLADRSPGDRARA